MARPLVQSHEPATGIIVIDISAAPDCTDAINDLSGLIEFKRYLGQAIEIAVWIRAYHKGNLWFRESDFSCRFHRTADSVGCRFRFLVASPAVLDLLL